MCGWLTYVEVLFFAGPTWIEIGDSGAHVSGHFVSISVKIHGNTENVWLKHVCV